MKKGFSRLAYILIMLFLFISPNLVFIAPSLYGTYIVYLTWCIFVVALLPIIIKRGLGILGIRESISYASFLVIIFTLLGFYLGFSYRRSSMLSILIDLALLLIRIGATEVFRALVIMLISNRSLKIFSGTFAGLLFGSTIVSIGNRYFFVGVQELSYANILGYVPQILYNLLITEIHIVGGALSAITFRYIVDGYWRLSPYILSTQGLGVLWPVIVSFIYLALMMLLPNYERVRGYSRHLFKRSILRRGISVVLDILIIIMIAGISYSLYEGIVPLAVISGSMRPTIDVGDIVLVKRLRSPTDLGVGDIIAFWAENQIVVHRIVGIDVGGYITKGDANPQQDPFIISKDLVIGKVIGLVPKIGWITIIARSSFDSLRSSISIQYMGIEIGIIYMAAVITIVVLIAMIITMRNRR